ncbi:hypothetical protein QTO34_006408 [Cnephaeus nilssonii]|uniref:Uncharacterized protein n=1 Tax=Cnephaeus nilssonii TaxID=3371016 RepID=A0AA40HL72_CNENI|nr:hypothetical protein QTO34_006408 [Eptesicus nilssonii]
MLGATEPKATARGQAPTLKKAEGGGHSQGLGPWCRQKTGAGSLVNEGLLHESSCKRATSVIRNGYAGNHLAKNVTFTPTCAKTIDSAMLDVNLQVIKPVLSLGVLAELWLQFLEFEVGGNHHSGQDAFGHMRVGAAHLHDQNLAPLAMQSEHNTAAIGHLLCTGCLRLTGAGLEWYQKGLCLSANESWQSKMRSRPVQRPCIIYTADNGLIKT